jgi:general secretion pathway protein I
VTATAGGAQAVSRSRIDGKTEGFTLIEVLVALTILSLSLAIIYSVFSVGLRGRKAAENYEQATKLAESKLDAIGVNEPLQEGVTVGKFDDLFAWKTVVTPYREVGRDESKDIRRRPLTVNVTVSWGEPSEERSVSLTTLRLAPRS